MGTRLEQFIQDNRDQFDSDEPGEQVWEILQQKLLPAPAKPKVTLMTLFRFSAAAAILVLAGLGVYSLLNGHNKKDDPPIVQRTPPPDTANDGNDDILKDINPGYAREVYHFTQLIELKQQELKTIEKENPGLYKKFMTDIDKLDSSYIALKRELPTNPNREQLLEAMIENLRLQAEILNQQLSVIKQIKESKSNSHESNFKKT